LKRWARTKEPDTPTRAAGQNALNNLAASTSAKRPHSLFRYFTAASQDPDGDQPTNEKDATSGLRHRDQVIAHNIECRQLVDSQVYVHTRGPKCILHLR